MRQNTIIKVTNVCEYIISFYNGLLSIDLGQLLQFVITVRVGTKTQSIKVKGLVEYVYDDIEELVDNKTSQIRNVDVSLLYDSRLAVANIIKKLSEPQDTSVDNDILFS
jgi:hypothetical protein